SAPRAAVVVQGQTVLAPVDASPLGPDMRAFLEPSTAELSIDGVSVGKGRWQGRLPVGPHSFAAREAGVVAAQVASAGGATRAADVTVRLRVDPKHPRWAASKTTTIWLEALGGPVLAPSLASDAEGFCGSDTCPDAPVALGAMGALRGGFEFPLGVSVEVSG